MHGPPPVLHIYEFQVHMLVRLKGEQFPLHDLADNFYIHGQKQCGNTTTNGICQKVKRDRRVVTKQALYIYGKWRRQILQEHPLNMTTQSVKMITASHVSSLSARKAAIAHNLIQIH